MTNKIALSVELPIDLLRLSDLLDQDFVIASYCLEYPYYHAFYKERRQEKEVFTYLDNGAFELGKSIDSKEYGKLIDDIRPHVVVLPDVVNNARDTVHESRKFLKSFTKDVPCYMGVLQGTSLSDYLYCLYFYLKMAEHYPIRVIGIPYHLFYRPTLLRKYGINDICKEHEIQIHILGLPNPFEIVPLHNFSQVTSVDTSLPISAAWQGMDLAAYSWVEGFRVAVDAVVDGPSQDLSEHNIGFLKHLCHNILQEHLI
jgi:hypothetical protein